VGREKQEMHTKISWRKLFERGGHYEDRKEDWKRILKMVFNEYVVVMEGVES
jgi:hypothetical protein